MELFIALGLAVLVISGLLGWISRRNSGSGETSAENYSAETRKDWGPQ